MYQQPRHLLTKEKWYEIYEDEINRIVDMVMQTLLTTRSPYTVRVYDANLQNKLVDYLYKTSFNAHKDFTH
jgi:hypothetical protein